MYLPFGIKCRHFSNHTIIVFFSHRRIILYEHYLGSDLEFERFLRRVGEFWKIPFYFSLKRNRRCSECSQFLTVYGISLAVMSA